MSPRLVLAIGLSPLLLPLAMAGAQEPSHPAPPRTAPDAATVENGTVIKPVGPIDPGIQAKTPSPARFPTPVIKPVTPVVPSVPPRR